MRDAVGKKHCIWPEGNTGRWTLAIDAGEVMNLIVF